MEVDFGTPSSPSGSNQRASPFYASHPSASGSANAGGNETSGIYSSSSIASRKRRRSAHYFPFESHAAESIADGATSANFFAQEVSEEEEGSPTRKRQSLRRERDSSAHHFHALGQARAEWDEEKEEIDYAEDAHEYDLSDYGVDSPMHSLSLVSPSASVDGMTHVQAQQRPEIEEDDIDMSMPRVASPANDDRHRSPLRGEDGKFIPRQLKNRILHRSNAPIRPSPLTQTQQSDESYSSTDSSPRQYSMDTSASNSPRARYHPLRRSVTDYTEASNEALHAQQPAAVVASSADVPVRRASMFVERDHLPPSVRRASRGDRGSLRTPSPRPQFVSSDEETNMEEEAERDGPSRRTRGHRATTTLHPSPGLGNPSSYFPGGRQMLRYTMGYRDDCESCKNKIPGHYGHVVHRPGEGP